MPMDCASGGEVPSLGSWNPSSGAKMTRSGAAAARARGPDLRFVQLVELETGVLGVLVGDSPSKLV